MQISLPNGMTVQGLTGRDTLNIYADIFEAGCYAKHVALHDGDVVFDVGANTGLFIIWLNTLGVRLDVFAFEPVPAIFEYLGRNVSRYNRLPIELVNAGLSGRSGADTFTHYPRFSQASTLYPDESMDAMRRGQQFILDQIPTLPRPLPWVVGWTPSWIKAAIAEMVRRHYLKAVMVPCQLLNLSEFMLERGVERIDLLKIDAEGSEQNILVGIEAEDWPKIRQLIVEVHGNQADAFEMKRFLIARGYRVELEPNPAMPSLALLYAMQ